MAVPVKPFIHDSELIQPGGLSLFYARERSIPLEALLTHKRWLEYVFEHDYEAPSPSQFHMCRRILGAYDPATRTVLLSKKGSVRLRNELSEPDRRYSVDELFSGEFIECVVRPAHGSFSPLRG